MEYSKKIILVGQIGVGKTSLVQRYVKSIFNEDYLSTIGVKVDKKTVHVENDQVNLLIWDIAGEASFSKISKSYYLGAKGCIYVADCSRISTFTDYVNQVKMLKELIKDIKIITVANKIDLLDKQELEELKNNVSFDFYTSAKQGEKIEEVFHEIAKKVLCS